MFTHALELHRERERDTRAAVLHITAGRKIRLERTMRRREARLARLARRVSELRRATPRVL